MRDKKAVKTILYLLIPAAVLFALIFLSLRKNRGDAGAGEKVVIAVPYSEWVQDYETNYYTGWLEEKTGYRISFIRLEEGYERESLDTILRSENGLADAVFLPADQGIFSFEDYQDWIARGLLAAPADYLPWDSNLRNVQETCADADFERILGGDGKEYCFPSMDMARTGRNRQILWINVGWLGKLNLTMPRTVSEFREVLEAFWGGDPNGNGIRDELPLISCDADECFQSYLFLLNAFTYYDEEHLSWHMEDGDVKAGVTQEAFREGVAYCADLYGGGLLAGDVFPYTKKQLMELVNDPADIVGAFSSHGIADVIYTNNPGVLSRFVQLSPLSSDALERGYAVRTEIHPTIGGLIPANAAHKKEAAEIMDLMLSEEATLIALYGEEGIDWRFSRDGELSTYGTRAKITTIRYLKNERQNKNYAGAGPLAAVAGYTDGVTWNGDHSMTEYIDARAVKTYEDYYYDAGREEDQRALKQALSTLSPEKRNAAAGYLERELSRFITGEKDVRSDAQWERFLREYGRMTER